MGSCIQKESKLRRSKPEVDKTTLMMNPKQKNFEILSKLPREITFEILSRLPISSLLLSKFVCKLWNNSTADPLLASMHLSNAGNESLCLILHSEFPKFILYNVFVSDLNNPSKEWRRLKIPFQHMLPRFEIVGSCNGLLCVSDYELDDPVYIYNPFTRVYKQLPPKGMEHLNGKILRSVFGFGFHPKTNVYKVIKIVYYEGSAFEIPDMNRKPDVYVATLGTNAWRNKGQTHYQLTGVQSEALVNGKLHWLTNYYLLEGGKCQDIISFDLLSEEFQELPRPDFEGMNKHKCHLVALRGLLSAVISYDDGTNEIWMMKNYNAKESWSREFVIGKYIPRIFITFGQFSGFPGRGRVNGYTKNKFQVLCMLSNGEILLLYENQALVSFSPNVGKFKDHKIKGQMFEFLTTVHVGSLTSVDAAFNMPIIGENRDTR